MPVFKHNWIVCFIQRTYKQANQDLQEAAYLKSKATYNK